MSLLAGLAIDGLDVFCDLGRSCSSSRPVSSFGSSSVLSIGKCSGERSGGSVVLDGWPPSFLRGVVFCVAGGLARAPLIESSRRRVGGVSAREPSASLERPRPLGRDEVEAFGSLCGGRSLGGSDSVFFNVSFRGVRDRSSEWSVFISGLSRFGALRASSKPSNLFLFSKVSLVSEFAFGFVSLELCLWVMYYVSWVT